VKLQKPLRRSELLLITTVTFMGVALRLVEVQQPFVDAWSWRQADVAMVAENFYRHGFNIFYPQINWAGPSAGYVGIEFQIIAFIAALFYILFDVHEWIGRSISVLFFAVSVPFFYLLVRKVSNERSAQFAVGIYIFIPLGIFSGRSFMPDMASLSFSIMALYLFAEWLEQEKKRWLYAAMCMAASLAILVKLPAIIIGLPLLYMAWEKYRARLLLRRELWTFAALSLIPPLAWYSHAYLISISNFPYSFFGGAGLKLISLNGYMSILQTTVTSSLTPIVSAAMLVGIILPASGKLGRVFHWWLLAIILFVLIAGLGNNRHPWYQLPIVPVAAAFAGLTCDFVVRMFVKPTDSIAVFISACLTFFAALAYLSYTYVQPLYKPWAIPALNAGIELDRIAPAHALVIAANNGDSTAIYYSRRKGWHFPQGSMLWLPWPADGRKTIEELENLRAEGGRYLVFTESTFYLLSGKYRDFQQHLDSLYGRVRDTDEYIIFDLAGPRTQ
jgi:hypothetical protein